MPERMKGPHQEFLRGNLVMFRNIITPEELENHGLEPDPKAKYRIVAVEHLAEGDQAWVIPASINIMNIGAFDPAKSEEFPDVLPVPLSFLRKIV